MDMDTGEFEYKNRNKVQKDCMQLCNAAVKPHSPQWDDGVDT